MHVVSIACIDFLLPRGTYTSTRHTHPCDNACDAFITLMHLASCRPYYLLLLLCPSRLSWVSDVRAKPLIWDALGALWFCSFVRVLSVVGGNSQEHNKRRRFLFRCNGVHTTNIPSSHGSCYTINISVHLVCLFFFLLLSRGVITDNNTTSDTLKSTIRNDISRLVGARATSLFLGRISP